MSDPATKNDLEEALAHQLRFVTFWFSIYLLGGGLIVFQLLT